MAAQVELDDLEVRENEGVEQEGGTERLTATAATPVLPDNYSAPIPGIYGWKKRCLYFSLLLLLVLILLNIGLTLWIIFVLDFNAHGMGNLRITDSGLRLQGSAEFTDTLYAQTITSDKDNPLLVQSQKGVNVSSGDSKMLLSPDDVTITSPSFSVYTHNARSTSPSDDPPILAVTNQSVTVSADSLQVDGALGLRVATGVETTSLRPPPGGDLSLEAGGGGGLELVGGEKGLNIEGGFTGGGAGVDISSRGDLNLGSTSGSIVLSSSTIVLANIPVSDDSTTDTVMELCICSNSRKLYLVPASTPQGCTVTTSICDN